MEPAEDSADKLAKSAALAYDEIRLRMLDGRLAPGVRLREHVLAEEIGVSRTPVREALRRLANEGFVTLVANQGASVTEWTDRSLADLIDVRSEIIAMAARLAALRIDAAQLERLRELNGLMAELSEHRRANFLSEAARLNIAFHRVICDASGNTWIRTLLDQTAYLPLVQRAYHAFDSNARRFAAARYTELISALEQRDPEWSAAVIKAHFLAAKHSITDRQRHASGNGKARSGR